MQKLLQKPRFYFYAILALFFLQFLFVNPIGEFALNDDWVHTEIAKHWVDTGEFRMNPFAGPTFYVPILYSAGLIKLFGFSFTILRISTLLLTLATLVIFYKLLTDISQKPKLAFFLTLALWFNPIFYNSTFTFMTEIPALFFIVSGIYAYHKGFSQAKPWWLFLGSMLSILGMFTRQTNILVMVAAGLYALTQLKQIKFWHLLWSFGIPAILGLSIYYWLSIHALLPPALESHYLKETKKILEHAQWWLFYTLMYLGFFVSPIAAGWVVKNLKKIISPKFFIYPVAIIALALIIRYTNKFQFPYVLNIINEYGVGPLQGVLNGTLHRLFSKKIWGAITVMSAASAGWLLYIFATNTDSKIKKIIEKIVHKIAAALHFKTRWALLKDTTTFISLFGILFLFPILLFDSFDRYFLPLFVVAGVIISKKIKESEISWLAVAIPLLILAIFSISQTAFYLNFNKTRWEIANKILMESKLQPHNIDAGYEWDGWYGYWSAHEAQLAGQYGPWGAPWWLTSLFVNNTQDYIVSFSPIAPYKVVETKKIKGWNPNNTLYLLEKPKE